MRELVIVSGKGGTGKTSLTATFAAMAENAIFCDADVDASDLHLLLNPEIRERNDFMGGSLAFILPDECTQCGNCLELCRFEAISEQFVVDPIACEGCGVCVDLCPQEAIDFPVQKCGEWYISNTRYGTMVHARLGIAEENSGKLVSLVRQQATAVAEKEGRDLILTDGPPGIGCPVIAAIGGATALLIVVEPTVSGLHDMSRVADLAKHFQVPGLVCINKYDLNTGMSGKIEGFARERNMELVGCIPFDPEFTRAMVQKKNILEFAPRSPTTVTVRQVWKKILSSTAMNRLGLKDMSKTIR